MSAGIKNFDESTAAPCSPNLSKAQIELIKKVGLALYENSTDHLSLSYYIMRERANGQTLKQIAHTLRRVQEQWPTNSSVRRHFTQRYGWIQQIICLAYDKDRRRFRIPDETWQPGQDTAYLLGARILGRANTMFFAPLGALEHIFHMRFQRPSGILVHELRTDLMRHRG